MAMKHIDAPIYWAPTRKLGGGWLLWKDSPSPPAAPDPVATANAQTASNEQTARLNAQLNRVNQYTPWGSLTYTRNTSPDTFNQAGYDAAMRNWQTQHDAYMNYQNSTQGGTNANWNPFGASDGGYSGTSSPYAADPGAAPTRDQFTTGGNSDTWNSTITLSPEQQALLDSSNRISQSMASLGESQLGAVTNSLRNPLNFNSAPSQVTNVQGGPLANSAGYGSIQNDVDRTGLPAIQNQLDLSKVPGLIGGDQLADDLNTQRDSLYRQQAAYLDPQWQQRQHDLENQLAQQGVMQNSDAWNRAMDDMSRQRTFDYDQARQSAITGGGAEQSRLFGLGLAANQNAFNQALQGGTFANNAQNQGYTQRATDMQLHNAAQAQGFGQSLANAQLNNAAQGQAFNQGLMNANLQNAGRAQDINEIMMQRQQPLNELNALRTGSQVTAPQFTGVPQTNVAPTDVIGPINTAYQGQLAGYNAQVAQNNALTSGLFGLGSAAMMAPAGTFASLAAAF